MPEPHHQFDVPFAVQYVHRVRFTTDVLDLSDLTLAHLMPRTPGVRGRALAVIDANLAAAAPSLPQRLARWFAASAGHVDLVASPLLIPGGEQVKASMTHVHDILAAVDRFGLDRQSYIIAIGGGAMLDAVGLAAALAHRGVRLIRMPTTTLAQADSGVGVKNGVNALGQKNFIGTFAPPWAVVNDQRLLLTLPDRDWRCGFAEVLKVGLIKKPALFELVCERAPAIRLREPAASNLALSQSATLHLQHITLGGDPFETDNARPLDFGHWSAHKLEQLSGFTLRHGEAVAIGLALDVSYCARVSMLSGRIAARTLAALANLGLPLYHPLLHDPRLLEGLEEFRRHLGGNLSLTMLRAPGDPVEVHKIDEPVMNACIDALAEHHAEVAT